MAADPYCGSMAADRRIPAGVKFEIETQDSGSLLGVPTLRGEDQDMTINQNQGILLVRVVP